MGGSNSTSIKLFCHVQSSLSQQVKTCQTNIRVGGPITDWWFEKLGIINDLLNANTIIDNWQKLGKLEIFMTQRHNSTLKLQMSWTKFVCQIVDSNQNNSFWFFDIIQDVIKDL